MESLTEREKLILKHVILDFIRSATPVGSKCISAKPDVNLSSATVRNVMSGLEELNLLTHNHTSGGRVPTDKGYRYFVNELMDLEPLEKVDEMVLKSHINELDPSSQDIFKEVSKILGRLSKEISIVSQPYFSEGFFEKIELVRLASARILVIVSIHSGHVRTLMFDVESDISQNKLEVLSSLLNERLSGLSLKEIRLTFSKRMQDVEPSSRQLVKIFTDSIDKIFNDEREGMTLYIGGIKEISSQPEFEDIENYRNIIEITDDKEVVVHVLNSVKLKDNSIGISIGTENQDEKLADYSVVTTTYNADGVKGKIALIGPRRMDYSKMVSMLEFTSKIISGKLKYEKL
ncbi:MAG: heat-inducible transcriptional repressor HrcA [Ignavibacteria bacterium]|nr:heat-inducible transcriptional repressor HrcA [Ignavibacteria bacterium]